MKTYLVLTVIGDDKPGLVETLSSVIAAHEGNWLESSMSQLAGKFAGILQISVEEEKTEALIEAVNGLSQDLKTVIERVDADSDEASPSTVSLSLVGNDRPGIIREISHCLAEIGVNVEQLDTHCAPAPMSGVTLFNASATLRVPATVQLDKLQERLEQLADELIVEIRLT